MADMIEINGIETNNLKDISVKLRKHSINLIIGPSGSGKSSLAYDTIAQIGMHEMNCLFSDDMSEPDYRVKSYHNMLATVPLPQTNNNNNTRSTIGTYFGVNQRIALIYAVLLDLEQDFFVLNRAENLCPVCNGLGVVKELDTNLIVDFSLPLEKCPIKCWTQHRDFYIQIIKLFCCEKKIDSSKSFRELSNDERKTILSGESETKYTIRYRKAGVVSTRTTKYHGVLSGIPMIPKFTPARQFLSDRVCPCCNGGKYSPKHDDYKLHAYSVSRFMCTPFYKLHDWFTSIYRDTCGTELLMAVDYVSRFVKKSIELGLGHLFFNRSIPTLSGGELQRLRLVQLFNTQLSDLLIVLDEPLAGLSEDEKSSVYNNIMQLLKRHTAVIVDHHETFVPIAKKIIALGEKSGHEGGSIIDEKQYLESQRSIISYNPSPTDTIIGVRLSDFIYDYKGTEVPIAVNRTNIVTGKSGIGKSTFLREYCRRFFEGYDYISQKSLSGNKLSTVATSLDILSPITNDFAKFFKKEKKFFSRLNGGQGACSICGGVGYVEYGNEYQQKTKIRCRECCGTGFNKRLMSYRMFGKNLFDIWNMTITEAAEYYRQSNPKTFHILNESSEIMLGHLQIGQAVSTLSGGENIRLKIQKHLNTTAKVLGIDEPFRGLGNSEIFAVIVFLDKLIAKGKTIIVADHEENSFRFFSHRIFLTNRDAVILGATYTGGDER